MKLLPYFRWFPADAESDDKYSSMTDEELGFFHRCLNKSWVNCGLPADPGRRALVMRTPQKTADRLWRSDCWVTSDSDQSKVVNNRQELERSVAMSLSKVRAEAGQKGGKASAKGKQLLDVCESKAQPRAYDSVSDSVFDSVSEENNDADFAISLEELEAAWDRHLNISRAHLEPKNLVFARILQMNGVFDVDKFRENHPPWCEYWARKGWNSFGSVTFLGWIEAGMPLPPPESTKEKTKRSWKE